MSPISVSERRDAPAEATLVELLVHVGDHVDEGLGRIEAALQHDEWRSHLQVLLGGVREPDLRPLVQPAAR